MPSIYFDHAAAAPLLHEAREAMLPFLTEEFGNPARRSKALHNDPTLTTVLDSPRPGPVSRPIEPKAAHVAAGGLRKDGLSAYRVKTTLVTLDASRPVPDASRTK